MNRKTFTLNKAVHDLKSSQTGQMRLHGQRF